MLQTFKERKASLVSRNDPTISTLQRDNLASAARLQTPSDLYHMRSLPHALRHGDYRTTRWFPPLVYDPVKSLLMTTGM